MSAARQAGEAHGIRRRCDHGASKDIEDIVAILDGRIELLEEVRDAATPVRTFLADAFDEWLANDAFVDAVPGHLPGSIDNYARAEWILERVRALVALR